MVNLPISDTATVTVEANTVEEALDRLDREVGSGASVVSAEKIRKGGIGGFFAREVIEITASVPGRGGVENTFARMLERTETQEATTAPAAGPDQPPLQREVQPIASHPASRAPVIATMTVPPPGNVGPFDPTAFLGRHSATSAPSDARPQVRWDADRMLSVGLPEMVVGLLAGLEPVDDLGHLSKMASIVAGQCGTAPSGPHRLAGAAAPRLADVLEIAHAPEGAADAPIHLVVSADPLPSSLPGTPDIISWTDSAQAPAAITLALGTGATLGWSMSTSFGASPRRLTPLDAAWAIRDLMERR